MGGNVEAYHDHLAQAEFEKNRQLNLLQKFGMGGPADEAIYVLTHRVGKEYEFLVGTRGKPLLAAKSISVRDVVSLLKGLNHKVRQIEANED